METLKSIKREEIVESGEYMVVVVGWEAYKEVYVIKGKGNEVLELIDSYIEDGVMDVAEVFRIDVFKM